MFGELVEWVLNLDREFAFLLALPFVVAIAGLLSHVIRSGKTPGVAREDAGAYRVRPDQHVWGR